MALQNKDGTVNKNAVICSLCKKEFSYHRSNSSLTYHLNAKHVRSSSTVKVAASDANATVSSLRQPTLAELGKRVSKILFDIDHLKLTVNQKQEEKHEV